ncbi:hypothetical protein J6590_029793 [Homalodisca vitripennis]|nr:hypothetical protein J6590_029793 [Homalodisca vitripennis]
MFINDVLRLLFQCLNLPYKLPLYTTSSVIVTVWFQAGSEEYIDEVRASTTHSSKSADKSVSNSSRTHQEYRSVVLNSIPLPTTGGHVTVRSKAEMEGPPHAKTLYCSRDWKYDILE